MSCGVDCRCGSDPTLQWLWCRPLAAALIRPLAWEPPYATEAALEMAKRQKQTNKISLTKAQKQEKKLQNFTQCFTFKTFPSYSWNSASSEARVATHKFSTREHNRVSGELNVKTVTQSFRLLVPLDVVMTSGKPASIPDPGLTWFRNVHSLVDQYLLQMIAGVSCKMELHSLSF